MYAIVLDQALAGIKSQFAPIPVLPWPASPSTPEENDKQSLPSQGARFITELLSIFIRLPSEKTRQIGMHDDL